MTSENKEQAHKKEPLALAEVRACCDEIEQEFQVFKPTLKLIIVICGIQDKNATILEKQSEILALPNGQAIINKLKAHLENERCRQSVIALNKHKQKKLMGFSSETHYNAILTINVADHEDIKRVTIELYSNIWKTLSVIDDDERGIEETITRQDNIVIPKWNSAQTASRNMLADIFAGTLLEAKGQKGALKNLAKTRCKSCFEDLENEEAASNPFPIMLETVQMAFDDFNKHSNTTNPIINALNIVTEAVETADENTLRQWNTFIESAQEMAWGNLSVAQILGTAIYTSDNVYNRTSAYMIADILNTDPTPIIQFEGYNAFADLDSQQRSHKIACLETIEYLENRQIEHRNDEPFFNMAMHSCKSLLEGKPNGFCAPALTNAAQTIAHTPDVSKEEIASIFSANINALPWITIRNAHREIIALKRQGKDIDIRTIIEIFRRDEETRDAAILIKSLADMNLTIK